MLALFTVVICYFGYTTLFNDYWGNPNEKSRIYSAVALVEFGQFNFEPVFGDGEGELEWPTTIDKAVGADGLTYSDKFPLTVLLAVPVYALLKVGYLIGGVEPQLYPTMIWFRIWYGLVPFLLSLLFLYKLLIKELSAEKTYLLLFIYTFATMNFSFSFMAMDHMISELLLILRIWAWREKRSGFLVGVFALTTVMLIPIDVMFLIYIAVTAKDKKQVLFFLLGGLPSVAVYAGYHWAVFGTPFTVSYLHVEKTVGIREPFYHITWKKIWGTFFSPVRGFFFYSSVFLFAVPGIVKKFKDKDESAWIMLGVIVYYFTFNIGYREWHHGWTPGLRHFIPMIPVFMLFLGRELKDWETKPGWYKFLFITALTLSIFLNLLPKMSYVFYPSRIANPHLWAGAYFVWDQYFLSLKYGMFAPLIKWVVYLILFGGFVYLSARFLIRAKITGRGIVASMLGAVLFVGVIFMPHKSDTEAVSDLNALRWNAVDIGMMGYSIYAERWSEIQPEFEENEEIAEYAAEQFAKVWLIDEYIKDIEVWDDWLDENQVKEDEWEFTYEQRKRFIEVDKKNIESMKERYQLGSEYNPVDEEMQSEVWQTINQYKDRILLTDDLQEKRRMYEYLYYAYLSQAMFQSSWSALQTYLALTREWY